MLVVQTSLRTPNFLLLFCVIYYLFIHANNETVKYDKNQRFSQQTSSQISLELHREGFSLLQKIAANLPGMIFQFLQRKNGSQSVIYASSGCKELYELEPESVLGDFQVLRSLIHPQDVQRFAIAVAVAARTRKSWHWEGRIITPSGKLKWIEGACCPEVQLNGDILWNGLLMDITDRKQAEEKLRESGAIYRAILNAIPDLMFRISRDGEYLDFKGEGANVFIPKEEIVGKNLRDLLPADVATMSLQAIVKTLDSKTLQTLEYQLPTPLGMRDYEARLVVSGENEVLAIVRDITESKQAEIALRQSEEKFSKAFRCSPDAITISTLQEGRYIEVNESFVHLSGYTREEAIGKTAFELGIWVNTSDSFATTVQSADRTRLVQALWEKGVIRNQEFEFRKKSGETCIALVSAELIYLDGVPCLLSVSSDITSRKQAEAQLRLRAARDSLLAQTLARIHSSLNLDQILHTTVNEVRQFLQADRVCIGIVDNGQGKVIAESVDPNYPSILGWVVNDDEYMQELREFFSQNPVCVIQDPMELLCCPKYSLYYEPYQIKAVLGVPITVGDEFLGVLVAHQCKSWRSWQSMDIDLLLQISSQVAIAIQQAQLYQKLAQLNTNLERQVQERTAQLQHKMQELQELNRLKEVVLHTVSHDLRTSVMGTLMVLQNLLQQGKGDKQLPRTILQRMIQGNERQMAMINSLLEINCGENPGIILNQKLVNLGTLMPKIIQDLQSMLSQHQVTVTNLISPDLPLVMVDSTQLQRVIENIFTYIWQHNPPGAHLILDATPEAGMIRCTIADNSVGMSQLECDRLFDLYVRDPRDRISTAMGLKMYLCSQIITTHGGEIGVTSQPGSGSTFWFTLPLQTEEITSLTENRA